MANPIFASENYVAASGVIINVSSGDTYKERLYDQNPVLQWTSYGETVEASGCISYAEVVFPEATTFDTVVLQNINLKQFKIQQYDGANYQDIAELTYTVNALTSIYKKLTSPITTTKVKILMQSTITSNQEKKIGQFWALDETFELTEGKHTHSRADYKEGGSYYLASGKLETFTLFKKYASKIDFSQLKLASITSLKSIYDTDSNFTFILNYDDNVDGIWNVCWMGKFNYEEDTIRRFFKLSMELNEQ